MDYKKIIKNRNLRLKILRAFNFIPDKMMIKVQYRIKKGKKLNLKNPKRYHEKLQWYKLYYRDPLMQKVVDKYDVRDYVKQKGLEKILNKLYGVYDNPEDIDFDKLPNSFVLKDTRGSGGNSVILVKDKSKMDLLKIKEEMKKWVSQPINKKNAGREWVYDGKKHRIVVEEFLSDPNNDLADYKFFCFNGKPSCLYFVNGRKLGQKANFGIFNMNFEQLPYFRTDENKLTIKPEKPKNFNEMIEISKKLSSDFPHVRVDLYNINGNIRFGEMTFFDGSGYFNFEPDEFDYILGEQFELPEKKLKD